MKNILRGMILFTLISAPSLVYAWTNVYFSPNGGCQQAVITQIKKAHKSIDVAMYVFSSSKIARALVEAKKRHVKIRVSLDLSQIKDPDSKCKYLVSKGLNVKFHMGPGFMLDKFAVIDGLAVITGSFNWSAVGDKNNFEDLLIIRDKRLARTYEKQFKHLWRRSGQAQIRRFGRRH